MKEIHRGAEAVIYQDHNKVIKKRVSKGYRIKELDNPIRKQRTKREAKVLQKLEELDVPAPKLLNLKDFEIEMEHIQGKRLADDLTSRNVKVMKRVGELVAKMHDNEIIHGDLTTSNMIREQDIFMIDFGLSFFSRRIEDKAVDLHLLKEALEARHFEIFEEAFNYFKQGYKNSKDFEKVLKQLEKVEERGRYKKKSQ